MTRVPSKLTPTPLHIVQGDRIEALLQRAAADAATAQAAQPRQPQRWLVVATLLLKTTPIAHQLGCLSLELVVLRLWQSKMREE
ncbi:MAG: hypothetical protein ACK4R8_10690 [Thiobacillus sp.]